MYCFLLKLMPALEIHGRHHVLCQVVAGSPFYAVRRVLPRGITGVYGENLFEGRGKEGTGRYRYFREVRIPNPFGVATSRNPVTIFLALLHSSNRRTASTQVAA